MALKKSELYSSLWKSCDELRGGMDASQYKDYVLTLLFVKYVSDKYALTDKPFAEVTVPEGGSFQDMVDAKGQKDLGDQLNKIIGRLAEANSLQGVITLADFNDADKLGSGKEMVDRLTNLIAIFEDLDLASNRAGGDDLLGDAYEYLMRHFATESGKSKGQFYTPAEVSRILAQVVGIHPDTPQDATVYDPTCGSGSLLLKASVQARNGLSVYGQEMDNATYALCRMNMILHDTPSAVIWHGNTLANPRSTEDSADGPRLTRYDFAVANPPFSNKSWTNGLDPDHDHDVYGRFAYGVPPKKNGDYAFLLHIVASLKSTGKAAVILPHGVLFRGNAEALIRQRLVKQGFIKGIIGLPANLFYGTGIPACIVVIDKENHAVRSGIFLVDASQGFVKDGNKNRLRARDLHQIVDVFHAQREVPGYSRLVPLAEVAANDYNLNLPRYIDTAGAEDLHDLEAHLRGGIPQRDVDQLEPFWAVLPAVRRALFAPDPQRPGYSHARVPAAEVKQAILTHPDFEAFAQRIQALFAAWTRAHTPALRAFGTDQDPHAKDPKALIHTLAEDLLARFADAPLVDRYALYQRLMDYWQATLQDDAYLLSEDGWAAGRVVRPAEGSETPEFKHKQGRKTIGYVGALIPARLLIEHFMADEQATLEAQEADLDAVEQRLAELEEEETGDGGTLDGLEGTRGVSKAHVQTRVMELKAELLQALPALHPAWDQVKAIKKSSFGAQAWTRGLEDDEGLLAELDVLHEYLHLTRRRSDEKKAAKAAQQALYAAVHDAYGALTDEQVVDLVVTQKWLATLEAQVHAEVERVTQRLTGRVQSLEERYADPLPDLAEEVEHLQARVHEHLMMMGVTV